MATPSKKSKTSEIQPAINEYFLSSSIKNTVKIYVGPKRKLWTLPEDILCSRVEYFRKAFKGWFKEGITKELYFPEDDSASFGHLVDWIFGQKLDCRMNHGSSSAETLEHGLHWCRLGALADRLGVDALSTIVAAQYEQCLEEIESNVPAADIVSYICENMRNKSKLRELAAKRYAKAAMTSEWEPNSWMRGAITDATFKVQVIKGMRAHMRKFARPSRCDLESCVVHGRT
ncbi:hypothetical protein EAF04_003417 [Stromatinia cepivora]|nr:hypothetical protein EAF04_003417 [Stromatinia cepivora]